MSFVDYQIAFILPENIRQHWSVLFHISSIIKRYIPLTNMQRKFGFGLNYLNVRHVPMECQTETKFRRSASQSLWQMSHTAETLDMKN